MSRFPSLPEAEHAQLLISAWGSRWASRSRGAAVLLVVALLGGKSRQLCLHPHVLPFSSSPSVAWLPFLQGREPPQCYKRSRSVLLPCPARGSWHPVIRISEISFSYSRADICMTIPSALRARSGGGTRFGQRGSFYSLPLPGITPSPPPTRPSRAPALCRDSDFHTTGSIALRRWLFSIPSGASANRGKKGVC